MINIKDVSIDDADELLKIYEYYVLNTAITFEIKVPTLEEFKERIINITKNYPYLILKENNKIIGYAYANVFKGREAYKHSVELSIYLNKDFKGNGYGKILYLELEKRLKEKGIKNLYACISSPVKEDIYLNNDSEKFHEHLGFKRIGLFSLCGYKFNNWYNMIWMEKIIGKHE